ncbi:hypothetical protein MPSEU_000743700 [Mayamaea pseudoterrestris]|nr:hypothetical protein MPSEU_000743700 [Mayamaea pseudoterrestris]
MCLSTLKPSIGWMLILLTASRSVVNADFGDAVDPTFNCPAFTTCKQVCVAKAQDCPDEMLCPANQTLCKDGSCSSTCDASLESPCQYDCAPVACHKVDSYYDSCLSTYGPWYNNETTCGETEEELLHKYSMREPVFVILYVWISLLTLCIVAWCAYNQRIAPVSGSVQPLNVQVDKEEATSWQTGYRRHLIGSLLYGWTCLTLLGMHALLGWLSVQYYIQQELLTGVVGGKFEDEENLLKIFEILWMVFFVFSFALKWPYSIKSLFLRRCELHRATHVAVCIHKAAAESEETFNSGYMSFLRLLFANVRLTMGRIMSLIFSDVDDFGQKKGRNGTYRFCVIQTNSEGSRYFVFGFRHYNFDSDDGRFKPGVYSIGTTLSDIVTAGKVQGGLTNEEADARRQIVGPNAIEMDKPNLIKIITKEFLKPFYTYQLFMVWTWVPLYYYYMAFTWTVVITTGGLTVCYFQYRNERKLYEITNITGEVCIRRDGQVIQVSPKELVPGDVVEVTPGLTYCDMVVVASSTILMDESALTGEATPMLKTPVDEADGKNVYSANQFKRHTILAGTNVLETEKTVAVVTQTASYTARGELIRDIYSYKRHQFKFDVEVPIVISILCFYAIFGFAMVVFFIKDTIIYSWFYGMFVVASALPPLLPTVFTVSVGISSDRLAGKRISCTNAEAILVCGKCDTACFDKTGTLTKQGLEFVAANARSGVESEFFLAMGSCHTLSMTKGGKLAGNPVDQVMFEKSGSIVTSSSGAVGKVTDCNGQSATIVRHFDFDHHRMTQSVLVRKDSDNSLIAFVKGSGESIKKLCMEDNLPFDFDEALQHAAIAGLYQISVAMKKLPATIDALTVTRDEIENSLSFIGTVDFKNIIRPETAGVISHLHSGSVKTVMLTGDSVLTGICIGREAGIVGSDCGILIGSCDESGSLYWSNLRGEQCTRPPIEELLQSGTELAISGQAFGILRTADPKEAARLMDFIRVYGRCTPYDKVSIVSAYNELGRVTLMCGDGGNDCGALKTAHVGVALSDAEASTVAPFTSLDKAITSVVDVLLEGRCSLTNSLAAYRYMMIYGNVETINQLISAFFATTFTEYCWVFFDGVWVITMAFSLPLARCASKLSKTRPTASLFGSATMTSVLGVLGLNFLFLVGALAYLFSQDWFQCRKWDGQDVSNVQVIGDNYESEVIFLVTGYQYISSAFAFNFGYEWRQHWFRNYVFMAFVTAFTVMQFYITLVPGHFSCIWRVNCMNDWAVAAVTSIEPVPIQNSFNTTVMPADFRRGLLGIMIANAIAVSAWEYFIVNGARRWFAARRRSNTDNAANDVSDVFCEEELVNEVSAVNGKDEEASTKLGMGPFLDGEVMEGPCDPLPLSENSQLEQ